MNATAHIFIELREGDVGGLRRAWKIARLLADLNENGTAEREIGYDKNGQLIHRWPSGESLAGSSVLDLAVFDDSTVGNITETEFERLWNEGVEDERFFAETDPYGDRFGTSISGWGWVVALAMLCGLSILAYRMIF